MWAYKWLLRPSDRDVDGFEVNVPVFWTDGGRGPDL